MPQRTLNWPRRIARADRLPLAAGHGSFCLHRVHLGSDAFDCQQIKLAGYVLILVREGSAILDSSNTELLLRQGDAALIGPSRFCITEIPKPGFSRGEVVYCHLNERVLADLVAEREGLDELAARISLPALPFYPIQGFVRSFGASPPSSLMDLRRVFSGLIGARPAMVIAFLKHSIFVPRLRLCIFLEEHCAGKLDASAIASRYPLGARAFRQNCANYLGMPVNSWLFRRRIELAHMWLRYTDVSEHDVASRLGYDGLRRFRGDMKRFGHFSPLELEVLRRFSSRENGYQEAPFWFPSVEARAAKFHRDHQDFLWIAGTPHRKRDLQALLRKYPDHKPAPAPSAGWLTADPRLDTGSDIPVDPLNGLENIIDLEGVEAWQSGKSSLVNEPDTLELAA